MKWFRVVPLVLSCLVLGAHFYRSGSLLLVGVAALAPLVLLVRRPWAVSTLQVALFVGAAEWVRTAVSIAAIRSATGQPATRMFIILGAVALFTAMSAVPLQKLSRA